MLGEAYQVEVVWRRPLYGDRELGFLLNRHFCSLFTSFARPVNYSVWADQTESTMKFLLSFWRCRAAVSGVQILHLLNLRVRVPFDTRLTSSIFLIHAEKLLVN